MPGSGRLFRRRILFLMRRAHASILSGKANISLAMYTIPGICNDSGEF